MSFPTQNLNIQALQQTTLLKAKAYLDGCANKVSRKMRFLSCGVRNFHEILFSSSLHFNNMRWENENSTLENQKFQLIIILQTAENLFLSSVVAFYVLCSQSF